MSARLMKEYKEAANNKDTDIRLTVQDNLYKWTAFIQGPAGTPFEGGDFQVQLDVQENYPHQAPKARFITKIFHPNIHFRTGEVKVYNSKCPSVLAITEMIGSYLRVFSFRFALIFSRLPGRLLGLCTRSAEQFSHFCPVQKRTAR